MNGKPQLVFGQTQTNGLGAMQKKASYTKPSLLPVEKGNSFASILSSTVDKSGGSFPVGGFSAGQSASVGDTSAVSLLGRSFQAGAPVAAQSPTKIGGATVQAANEASAVAKRTSHIGKNYSFGMDDTRQKTASKQPIVVGKQSSARQINAIATKQSSGGHAKLEQLMGNGASIRETPYRGLSLSRGDIDKKTLDSMSRGSKGSKGFYSPLLAGGSTQMLIQIVKEAGATVGVVSDRLLLKKAPPLAEGHQPTPLQGQGASPVASKSAARFQAPVKTPVSAVVTSPIVPEQGKLPPVGGIKEGGVTTGGEGILGTLSAKFESGESGIAAIGYDRHGGTSYGKYQISSKAGTFTKFLEYLDVHAPDMAGSLRAGGNANTGGRQGRMPNIWRSLAEADPVRFEQLQTDFIMSSHFEPAMSAIADATGVAFTGMPEALREVIFSTAVQHGVSGAARIISRAVNSVGAEKLTASEEAFLERTGQDLIKQIYTIRARQFASSTNSVRSAVQGRLRLEMNDAITLLHSDNEQRPQNPFLKKG